MTIKPTFKIGDRIVGLSTAHEDIRGKIGTIKNVIDDEPDELFTNLIKWDNESEDSWVSSESLSLLNPDYFPRYE